MITPPARTAYFTDDTSAELLAENKCSAPGHTLGPSPVDDLPHGRLSTFSAPADNDPPYLRQPTARLFDLLDKFHLPGWFHAPADRVSGRRIPHAASHQLIAEIFDVLAVLGDDSLPRIASQTSSQPSAPRQYRC